MEQHAHPLRSTEPLDVISLDHSLQWLRDQGDPTIDLWLATAVDSRPRSECADLVDAVHESDPVRDAFSSQHRDGSWGPADADERTRILPTLRVLQTLVTYGVGPHERAAAAMGFLCAEAHTEREVFTIDGRRDGVLSCYVAMAASVYLSLGAPALAAPQIDWILRYQDVTRCDHRYRADEPECWDDYLRSRHGGCMAGTTCLVGLVKAGRALQVHADSAAGANHGAADDPRVPSMRRAVRDAFLDRALMFTRDGRIVPVGVAASKPAEWLLPSFPLDWRTDLIEVLDVVARSGPSDPRMQPAIDALTGWRLPDGSWPLRRSMWPDELSIRDRRRHHRGHAIVTMRAVAALRAVREGMTDRRPLQVARS